ncbi:MAG TPA: DUF3592 domain-containing protein [Thermoanaerobaculia bacterium]|nr:DUF3592 domain-containing protein [Thermoanaerobaculia bacterium]
MTFLLFCGVVFLATGIGILVWTAWNYIFAVLSRRWPEVAGTVIVSHLQSSRDEDGGYLYRPEVSYRYTVDGETYISGRVRFGDRISLGWSGPAARIVERYRSGAAVSIRYDAGDPAQAVIEPGMNGYILAGASMGGIFTYLGIALTFT